MALEDKIKELLEGKTSGNLLSEEELNATLETEVEVVEEEKIDHIAALVEGEELSEEFKAKAAVILEAAIADGVAKEVSRLEESYAIKLDEATNSLRDELVENIDGYLTAIAEQWAEDNELSLSRGIKGDIVENFIDGLKTLFTEHYIDVPEDKIDILDEQAAEIDALVEKLQEATETNETLAEQVVELTKTNIMEAVGSSLSDTEFEKFSGLCEGVAFMSEETYEEKVKTIKETYFPKVKRESVISESDTPAAPAVLVEGAMTKYVSALANPLAFKR